MNEKNHLQDAQRRALLKISGAMSVLPVLQACGGGGSDGFGATGFPSGEAPRAAAMANLTSTPQAKALFRPVSIASRTLWYDGPASDWESEALPIGNARMGAMLFGGTSNERIQFNEQSMWSGVNNYDNALAGKADTVFDRSMSGFGSYQNFGEFNLAFDGMGGESAEVAWTAIQGSTSLTEDVSKTVDGNAGTKWCISSPGSLVHWQADLSQAAAVTSYSLTSANDVPMRDPQEWTLAGSNNGIQWTVLDTRVLSGPFESRGLQKTFTFGNGTAYRFYRFAFTPKAGVSHFQVAEIKLEGTNLAQAKVSWPAIEGSTSLTEDVSKSIDGSTSTKWCISGPGSVVHWRVKLIQATVLTSYSLTSANDVPMRDPQEWTFAGSNDGINWTALDTRTLSGPFESRALQKTFTFSNSTAYRFYRFAFVPKAGVSHFQVAEIKLTGVDLQPGGNVAVTDYRRSLDLGTGVHRTEFTVQGRRFVREAFASKVDDVMVFRYSCSDANALSGTLSLSSAHLASTVANAGAAQLSYSGVLGNQLRHACAVQIVRNGGQLVAVGKTLRFSQCDSFVLLVDARTDYKLDHASGWRGADPGPFIQSTLAAAAAKTYDTLRQAHIADFSALMARASVTWGDSAASTSALSTKQRLQNYQGGTADPDLEQTMFDYGRYLLISASRKGGLPANLQGLWNDSNSPAWASDYHTNINVQMNYWGAESTGLGECHEALIDFIGQVAIPSRAATKNAFGATTRGWTARTSQSVFGGNGWKWNIPASAWYCQHLYEHYAFTQDLDFLRNMAYPMIKEICEFWQDHLKATPDGLLVAPDGWSPEHGPVEDGVMHDQQIIWDLFQNYLDSARVLNTDTAYQATVSEMQRKLAPNKIGSWGQLQEWQVDRDSPTDRHRHTSHLFAVYPGRQITPTKTPGFASAAMVSLKARCGEVAGRPFTAATVAAESRRSWTWPWRCALFARLGDAARAQTMLRGLLTYSTMQNLFCNHPPFQMDGNFGITGAVTEMLLQSHEDMIVLLPACPEGWKSAGAFNGLRARGGYRVSCEWKDGQVQSYEILADKARDKTALVKIRVNGQELMVQPTAI